MKTRLLITQYAGDYREAVKRFAAGGEETYYAQKHSVDAVANLTKHLDEVATLTFLTETPYNERLVNGVQAIGAGFSTDIQPRKLLQLIEQYNPTHILTRTPNQDILRWAIQNHIKVSTTLADSFKPRGIRNRIKNYQLANLLNHPNVEWVGNHGINASASLAEIGVNPDKIIPWDWPHECNPKLFSAKQLQLDKAIQEIVYVGSVEEAKGIGDVLRAIVILKENNRPIRLKVIGQGQLETYIRLAEDLQIDDRIEFLGLLPHKQIVPAMRAADIVVIPSRHDYPEGCPMTLYEALCARTPIIASDHPMFNQKLVHQLDALIFPSGNPFALAKNIETLLSSPSLYQTLSSASFNTWKRLQLPVKWVNILYSWLLGNSNEQQWLFEHRLASGRYDFCPNDRHGQQTKAA